MRVAIQSKNCAAHTSSEHRKFSGISEGARTNQNQGVCRTDQEGLPPKDCALRMDVKSNRLETAKKKKKMGLDKTEGNRIQTVPKMKWCTLGQKLNGVRSVVLQG